VNKLHLTCFLLFFLKLPPPERTMESKRKTQSTMFPWIKSKRLHSILDRVPSKYNTENTSSRFQHPLKLSTWGLHNPDDDHNTSSSTFTLEHQSLYDELMKTFRPTTGSKRFVTKN